MKKRAFRPLGSQPGHVGPERRTQLRLRALIDDLKAAIERNRLGLEMHDLRMEKIQTDIEALKRGASEKSGAS